MSGHEKFYIPHDDLLELKDSIDTLDASIITLDASITTLTNLTAELLLPTTELVKDVTDDSEAAFDSVSLINEVLHATKDVFLTRIIMRVHAGTRMFDKYDAEAKFVINASGAPKWVEPVCGGTFNEYVATDELDTWTLERSMRLRNIRVVAGGTVHVQCFLFNMPNPTTCRAYLFYVTEGTT